MIKDTLSVDPTNFGTERPVGGITEYTLPLPDVGAASVPAADVDVNSVAGIGAPVTALLLGITIVSVNPSILLF